MGETLQWRPGRWKGRASRGASGGASGAAGGGGTEVDETNSLDELTGLVSVGCGAGSGAWRRWSLRRASRKLRWVELTMRWRRLRERSPKLKAWPMGASALSAHLASIW